MAPPRFMIVSDLDHTTVDHHDSDNTSLLRFNALWGADYYYDSLLVFSTGRSPTLYKELRTQKPLLTPDIAIMSVGTEIMYGDTMTADEGWQQELNKGWDRAVVVEEASNFPQLRFQTETEQRPHKVSFHVEKAYAIEIIKVLSERFRNHGLKIKLIYSGGVDLDILPQGAGKGEALAYLLHKFRSEGSSPLNTLVCGDSGNDVELFSVAEVYGVMVGNAQEELLHWYAEHAKGNPRIFHASERCAAGIIQAMQHFNLQPYISPRDMDNLLIGKQVRSEFSNVGHEVVEYHMLWERWERAEVENSDETFQRLKQTLAPTSSLVLPWGVEVNPFHTIEGFRSRYGASKGKHYRIWIDRVRTEKLADGKWVVKFDKWNRNGDEVCCRMTTAVLQSKPDTTNGVWWTHIHETWLEGYSGSKSF